MGAKLVSGNILMLKSFCYEQEKENCQEEGCTRGATKTQARFYKTGFFIHDCHAILGLYHLLNSEASFSSFKVPKAEQGNY